MNNNCWTLTLHISKRIFFSTLLAWITVACSTFGAQVSYKPPIVPVEVSINTSGEIIVAVSKGILVTPIGVFSVGAYVNPSEYFKVDSTLTVRLNGQDTIYALEGENFNVDFQSGYYRKVALSKNGSNLILEVERMTISAPVVPPVAEEEAAPLVSLPPDAPQWLRQLSTNPIIANVGLANVQLGDGENKVINTLGLPSTGEPIPVETNGQLEWYRLCYDYRSIFLCVYTTRDTRKVWSMRLVDNDFNKHGYIPNVQGVTIGSTKAQLIQSFGEPKTTFRHVSCPENSGSLNGATLGYSGISFWVCDENELVNLIDIPAWPASP